MVRNCFECLSSTYRFLIDWFVYFINRNRIPLPTTSFNNIVLFLALSCPREPYRLSLNKSKKAKRREIKCNEAMDLQVGYPNKITLLESSEWTAVKQRSEVNCVPRRGTNQLVYQFRKQMKWNIHLSWLLSLWWDLNNKWSLQVLEGIGFPSPTKDAYKILVEYCSSQFIKSFEKRKHSLSFVNVITPKDDNYYQPKAISTIRPKPRAIKHSRCE